MFTCLKKEARRMLFFQQTHHVITKGRFKQDDLEDFYKGDEVHSLIMMYSRCKYVSINYFVHTGYATTILGQ